MMLMRRKTQLNDSLYAPREGNNVQNDCTEDDNNSLLSADILFWTHFSVDCLEACHPATHAMMCA